MNFDVTGFGALNMDYIYQLERFEDIPGPLHLEPGREYVSRPRQFQETRNILDKFGKLKRKTGGGSAANTIYALAGMGFRTAFIGKVGEDSDGDIILDSLRGIDKRGIRRQGRTGACLIAIDKREDRCISVFPNTNNTASLSKKNMALVKETKVLHFSSFAGRRPFLSQIRFAQLMPEPVKLSFDPGEIYAAKGLMGIAPVLEKTFVLFITENEINKLTGKNYREGISDLLEMGPSIVACKRGKLGSLVSSREERIHTEADRVQVVDNTGAGDVYNAGFLAGLLMHLPLKMCAGLATKCAAKSITGFGRCKYPTKRDLKSFIELVKE